MPMARALAEELMDDPMLDPQTYARVLGDLAKANAVTLARRPTMRFLRRALGERTSFRLLDIGYGNGDMLRRIAQWVANKGLNAELVGVDLNPKSAEVARSATIAPLAIEWRTGDYAAYSDESWDFIVSSLVAHHMTHDQLVRFLQFMETHAKRGWLINDLHRHRLAWIGFPLLARMMRWHKIVRADGQLSVARSYRPNEWCEILDEAGIKNARVFRAFPFRLCVESIR